MIVVDPEGTGKRIRGYMNEHDMSVIDLRERLNLSASQSIYHWLCGMSLPKIDHLVILADMFGVTMDDIVMTKRI